MIRPKDCKVPTPQDRSTVHMYDGMLLIPRVADVQSFRFPGWEEVFGNDLPIHVEFCSGNGLWIAERARLFPQYNWVAVEMRFERVRRIWSKRQNLGLNNLFIVYGDARLFAHEYIPPHSVSALFINFPDPWPKNRHEKHRLISAQLFADALHFMQKGGAITLVTDDLSYARTFSSLAQGDCFSLTDMRELPNDYGGSSFREIFVRQNIPIFYQQVLVRA